MSALIRPEFAHKSRSKRQRIFKNRLRKPLCELAWEFSRAIERPVDERNVMAVTEEVLDGIIDLVRRDPTFLDVAVHPNIKDDSELVDIILENLTGNGTASKPLKPRKPGQ